MQHQFSGAVTTLAVHGRHFVYASNNAALVGSDGEIDLWVDGQRVGVLPLGARYSVPADQAAGQMWEIRPADPTIEISGTVHIGDDRIDLPIIGGTVQVVDSGVQQTLARTQFWGSLIRTAAAGLFSSIGLVAMGSRSLVVRGMTAFNGGTASTVRLWIAQGVPTTWIASRPPKNRLLSEPSAVHARIMAHDSGTAGGAAPDFAPADLSAWLELGPLRAAANDAMPVLMKTPFVLEPGTGLYVVSDSAAATMGVQFDVEELP